MELLTDYKYDAHLRNAFFDFTAEIFQINLRRWYEAPGWDSTYTCFSFIKEGKMLVNVSLSTMEVLIHGQSVKGIQLATVDTIPQYRKAGLAAQLIRTFFEHRFSTIHQRKH